MRIALAWTAILLTPAAGLTAGEEVGDQREGIDARISKLEARIARLEARLGAAFEQSLEWALSVRREEALVAACGRIEKKHGIKGALKLLTYPSSNARAALAQRVMGKIDYLKNRKKPADPVSCPRMNG